MFVLLIILFFTITSLVSSIILFRRRRQKQKKREERHRRRLEKIGASPGDESPASQSNGREKKKKRKREEAEEDEDLGTSASGSGSGRRHRRSKRREEEGGEDGAVEKSPKKAKYRKKTCAHRFMTCFSISRNSRALFKKRAKPEDKELEALNGVRVICLVIIILGNTFFYILKGPLQNLEII